MIRALFSSLTDGNAGTDVAQTSGDPARYDGTLIARNLTKSYKSRRVVDGIGRAHV